MPDLPAQPRRTPKLNSNARFAPGRSATRRKSVLAQHPAETRKSPSVFEQTASRRYGQIHLQYVTALECITRCLEVNPAGAYINCLAPAQPLQRPTRLAATQIKLQFQSFVSASFRPVHHLLPCNCPPSSSRTNSELAKLVPESRRTKYPIFTFAIACHQ